MIKIIIDRKLNNNIFNHEYCIVTYNSLSQVNMILNFSRSITAFTDIQQSLEQLSEDEDYNYNDNDPNVESSENGPDLSLVFKNLDILLASTASITTSTISSINLNSTNYLYRCILIYGRSNQVYYISIHIFSSSQNIFNIYNF